MPQPNDKNPGLSWSTPSQSASKFPSSTGGTTKNLPPAPEKSTPVATYVVMVVGGIIIGVLLAWGWTSLRSQNGEGVTTSTSTKTNTANTGTSGKVTSGITNIGQSDELTVPSPQKAGQSVVITQANIGAPTWVVVYEDRDGAPGNVLGAQLFFTSGPGIVTLLRGTEAGETYYVGKSVDDGDHKYTKATDKSSQNTDGSLAVVGFVAN